MFSAMMPNEHFILSTKFVRNPVRILVKTDELTLKANRQFYVTMEKENWELTVLCDFYGTRTITHVIIYCYFPCQVDFLAYELAKQ